MEGCRDIHSLETRLVVTHEKTSFVLLAVPFQVKITLSGKEIFISVMITGQRKVSIMKNVQ